MFLTNLLKKYLLAAFVAFFFFIIPFFWYPAGAMDLGGDGTRLYFYDPLEFLKNASLYGPAPDGKGIVDPTKHAYLVYVSFLAILKFFIPSTNILINIFNGIKLSIGFLSIYFIVKEFIPSSRFKNSNLLVKEFPAVIAGSFYILATGSENLIFQWSKALFSHDQIFLNPLVFFLLMRYLLTNKIGYLFSLLLLTFIFSANFAMIASPPFFAFYPIAVLFLVLYIIFIKKRKIFLKDIIISLILFVGLHSFHLLPEIYTLFDKGSTSNSIVFKETVSGGVQFFEAIRGEGKVSRNFLVSSPVIFYRWTSFVAAFFIVFGGLFYAKKSKQILLTYLFFLITLFLVSANITNIGYELYKGFFYIPGFSMFRHFYGQWAFVFIFFYSLLFGQSLAHIFQILKKRYIKMTTVVIFIIFIMGYWSFLNGHLVNAIHWGSKNVKTAFVMDPKYEQTLHFIRKLPDEGKMLVLPLTDNFNQVIYGLNDAAYVGPSTISFITPKKSFSGYQIFYPNPIPEEIMRFAREENYKALTQIFSLFNIRYIFHNTDPKIYEERFPQFPNSYMMTSLPKTQKEYKQFVKNFPVKLIYKNGSYEIYEFIGKVYRKEVYIPASIIPDDMINVVSKNEISYQSAFIDKKNCKKNPIISSFCKGDYRPPDAKISIVKKNPTEYTIHIKQSESEFAFLLVFQNSYHTDWKLSFDQKSFVKEENRVLVNQYANGWIITNKERNGKTDYTLYLTLKTQRRFQYGLIVTKISLATYLIFLSIHIASYKWRR